MSTSTDTDARTSEERFEMLLTELSIQYKLLFRPMMDDLQARVAKGEEPPDGLATSEGSAITLGNLQGALERWKTFSPEIARCLPPRPLEKEKRTIRVERGTDVTRS